jgi:hypothetical protein
MECVSIINVSVIMVIMALIVRKLNVSMIVINAACVRMMENVFVGNTGVQVGAENISFANQKTFLNLVLVEILPLNLIRNLLVFYPDVQMIVTITGHAPVMDVSATWGGLGNGVKSNLVLTTANLMASVTMVLVIVVQASLVLIVIGLKTSLGIFLVPPLSLIIAQATNNVTNQKENVPQVMLIMTSGVQPFMM